MRQEIRRVAVYCGSSQGIHGEYASAAREAADEIVVRGLELVYGGGRVGLMGVLADGVLARGGRVHGVITEALLDAEVGHQGLSTLEVLPTMHDRKARMASLADAFLALPGGFGTFEELFEVLTWTQLGLHRKPVAVVNVRGFFDPLLAQTALSVQDGFMKANHGALLRSGFTAKSALDSLLEPLPLPEPKWVGPGRG